MKNYWNSFFVAIISLLVISCQSDQNTPVKEESKVETKAVPEPAKITESSLVPDPQETDKEKVQKVVSELPEYKDAQKMIDSLTQGKHGISMMVEKPEQGKTDYTVTIGYNGKERFETYGVYFVNPKTRQVKLYDDMSGEVITIEAWRNRVGD